MERHSGRSLYCRRTERADAMDAPQAFREAHP